MGYKCFWFWFFFSHFYPPKTALLVSAQACVAVRPSRETKQGKQQRRCTSLGMICFQAGKAQPKQAGVRKTKESFSQPSLTFPTRKTSPAISVFLELPGNFQASVPCRARGSVRGQKATNSSASVPDTSHLPPP